MKIMKVVYIAHPIGADSKKGVRENIIKVRRIIRYLNLTNPDIVPFAHYLVHLECLNDNKEKERERGIMNDHVLFRKGFIDELWLYGTKISKGMFDEILMALSMGMPVIPKTEYVSREFDLLLRKWKNGGSLHEKAPH